MEEKIENIATSVVGGSIVVMGLVFIGLIGLPLLLSGEVNLTLNSFATKVIIISILYLSSIFLVATIPGKTYRRKVISWVYSIIFHSCLLVYLYKVADFGVAVYVLGIPEIIILSLSVLGVILSIYNNSKN